MQVGMVANTKDLPVGWSVQIGAISYFDAAFIKSTANVELAVKDAAGMVHSWSIEVCEWAPLISFYVVNFHRIYLPKRAFSSGEEQEATRRAGVTG